MLNQCPLREIKINFSDIKGKRARKQKGLGVFLSLTV